MKAADFSGLKPTWCPGCGNFGILQAINKALVALNLKPHQVLMVSGIGQAGKLPHYSHTNIFNSLHGRALPVAIGAKLTNHDLTVIASGGDGDGYGEGGNHLLHAMRRNHDITYLVHNNQVYGLTKGQASPTSDQGFITKTTPDGAPQAINPIGLALVSGASFIARGFSGDGDHLSGLIQQAIKHKGFALLDMLQPCVSFNHKNTFKWYQERVYRLENEKGYSPADKQQAWQKSQEWGNRIPIGVIYREQRPTFEEQQSALKKGALIKQKYDDSRVKDLIKEFC